MAGQNFPQFLYPDLLSIAFRGSRASKAPRRMALATARIHGHGSKKLLVETKNLLLIGILTRSLCPKRRPGRLLCLQASNKHRISFLLRASSCFFMSFCSRLTQE